jgi:hypothetical protein
MKGFKDISKYFKDVHKFGEYLKVWMQRKKGQSKEHDKKETIENKHRVITDKKNAMKEYH